MKWGKLSADVAGVRVQPRANVMDESPGPPSESGHVAFARLVRMSEGPITHLTMLVIAGLILSPPGRATGCHMNPAISLAMWRFGVFPGAGVMPYIVAQLLGSVFG